MQQQLYSLFLILIALASQGCRQVVSQTTLATSAGPATTTAQPVVSPRTRLSKAPVKGGAAAPGSIIAHAENSKYGLSVSIYMDKLQDNFNIYDMTVSNERTGQSSLARYTYERPIFPAKAAQVWSPDEEYLVLPCAGEPAGFCFYRAAQLVVANAKNDRGEDCEECFSFQPDNEPLDRIVIGGAQGAPESAHQFGRWASNTSFIFMAQRVPSPDSKRAGQGTASAEYKYDLADGTLFCLAGNCAPGANKKGAVKPVATENTRPKGGQSNEN